MDITWYGHSCFRIVERSQTTVVTDPYAYETLGLPELNLKGDVVTVSHDAPGHNAADAVKGAEHVLSGPGEYEIGGVFITGIPMHYVDEESGEARYNVAYRIEYTNNLTVLHPGDLSHVPDQTTIEALGEVNVVLMPVGGGNSLRAGMAAEVVAMIEPNYVIPMHYHMDGLSVELEPVEKFLKAMGISKVQEEDTLRVTSSGLPEQPQVVVLSPQLKS
ncbi:MAG: MBL fold metallo-hydrolase [Aggregatilineales bacterium]